MILRRSTLVVLFLSLVTFQANGQIRIGIECDNSKFIVGETVMAKVVVNSDVALPLVFNQSYHNAELEICVIRDRSTARVSVVEKLERDFVLMPNESVTELVDVSSLLKLHKEGAYQVSARIRYDDKIFSSQAQGIDIVRGVELASRKRPLNGYPEKILTYSVRYICRSMSESAFLIVKDEKSGVSYGAIRLGPIVRVMEPSIKFDDKGRIEVVHQSGRKRFTRSVVRVHSEGAEFVEQTHHKRDGSQFRN